MRAFAEPLAADQARYVELIKNPMSAGCLPSTDYRMNSRCRFSSRVGDDISTGENKPAGAKSLSYRSNVPNAVKFVPRVVDTSYPERAGDAGKHDFVGGETDVQESNREHGMIGPRYLGSRAVIFKSVARTYLQNQTKLDMLQLVLEAPDNDEKLGQNDAIKRLSQRNAIEMGERSSANVVGTDDINFENHLSQRQRKILLAGGQINGCWTCG